MHAQKKDGGPYTAVPLWYPAEPMLGISRASSHIEFVDLGM